MTIFLWRFFDFKKICGIVKTERNTKPIKSDASYNEPLYDQIVKETLQKAYLNKHQTTRNFYRQFSEMRDDNSPRIIEKHFWNIVENYNPPEY